MVHEQDDPIAGSGSISHMSHIPAHNPWAVANLDEYLFYCCPQCDYRNKVKDNLFAHAISFHEEAHQYLIKTEGKLPTAFHDEVDNTTASFDPNYIPQDGEDEDAAAQFAQGNLYIEMDAQQADKSSSIAIKPDIYQDDDDDDDFFNDTKDDNAAEKNSQDFQCYICGLTVPTVGLVKEHQKEVHNVDNEQMFGEPRDRCPVCHQWFDYKDDKLHECYITVKQNPDTVEPKVEGADDRTRVQTGMMCYKCGIVMRTLAEIKAHQKKVHHSTSFRTYGKPRDYQCPACKNMFETKTKMSVHICRFNDNHKKGDGFVCGKCGEKFKSELAYDVHMSSVHTNERRFECNKCDYKGKTLVTLRQHVRLIHENNVSHVCETCGKSFTKRATLRSHIATFHSGNKSFICDKCGAAFGANEYLRKHCRQSHPVYSLCTLCGKLFTVAKHLRQHLFTAHECKNNGNTMVCPACKCQFSSITELEEHNVNGHGMAKTVPCNYCDHVMTSQLSLKLHLVESHIPVESNRAKILQEVMLANGSTANVPELEPAPKKPGFGCDICGKVLSSQPLLVIHKRQKHEKDTHTFKCDQCDYSTFQHCLLKKHFLVKHDKSRKFQCPQCPKFFFVEKDLRTHNRYVHERIRRYKCTECDRAYNCKSLVNSHMLKVHGTVYFEPA